MSMFEEFDAENPDDKAPSGATSVIGSAFQAKGAARASKVYRDAVKEGKSPEIVSSKDGFVVQIPAPAKEPKPAVESKPHIDAMAHEAATSPHNDRKEPSQAQKEAGNYKKGRVKIQGLDIAIENPRGSDRSGVDPDGNEWTHTMSDHYGYIRKTMGADGDQLDVYVGPKPDSDKVFVIDQKNQQTGEFDEHKIMLGFSSQRAAQKAYEANFDDHWETGPITEMAMPEFKDWVRNGETSLPMSKEIKAPEKIEEPKPEPVVVEVAKEPVVEELPPQTPAQKAKAQAAALSAKTKTRQAA